MTETRQHPVDTGTAPWARPGWWDELTGWIDERLADAGIRRRGAPTHVRSWARSALASVETDHGRFWAKQVPAVFAHEIAVTGLLTDVDPGSVAPTFAVDVPGARMITSHVVGPSLADVVDLPEAWTATLARLAELQRLQARLQKIDTTGWPIPQQSDHHIVRAEMNGMEYHLRVLQPFARDPAYYVSIITGESDTPVKEGPVIHGAIRLFDYPIWPRTRLDSVQPLSSAQAADLATKLRTIPPLLEAARRNLAAGNARRRLAREIVAAHAAASVAPGADPAAPLPAEALDEIQIVSAWMRRRTGEGTHLDLDPGLPAPRLAQRLEKWFRELARGPAAGV